MLLFFTKEALLKVGKLCEDRLYKSITKLRTLTNINQYIYAYYHYFTNDYIDDLVYFRYFELRDDNITNIIQNILSSKYQIICINDSDKIKEFSKIKFLLTNSFEKKFPAKCKYEI